MCSFKKYSTGSFMNFSLYFPKSFFLQIFFRNLNRIFLKKSFRNSSGIYFRESLKKKSSHISLAVFSKISPKVLQNFPPRIFPYTLPKNHTKIIFRDCFKNFSKEFFGIPTDSLRNKKKLKIWPFLEDFFTNSFRG